MTQNKTTETVILKHFPGNGKAETTSTIEMKTYEQNGRREEHKTGFQFPPFSKPPTFGQPK